MDELYDDLENYNDINNIEELQKENTLLKFQLEDKQTALDKLQKDFDRVSSELKTMHINFSSLLKTARAEVERKSQLISNINAEKDALILNCLQNNNKGLLNIKRNLSSRWKEKVDTECGTTKHREVSDKAKYDPDRDRGIENRMPSTDTAISGNTDDSNRLLDVQKSTDSKDVKTKSQPQGIKSRRKSMPGFSTQFIKFSSDEEFEELYSAEGNKLKWSSKEDTGRKTHDKNAQKFSETSAIDEKYSSYHESSWETCNKRTLRFRDRHRSSRDKFEMGQRFRRHFSPERYRRAHRDHSDDRHQRPALGRHRILESPPSVRERELEPHRNRDRRSNYNRDFEERLPFKERQDLKHKTPHDYEEPCSKRARTDSSGRLEDTQRSKTQGTAEQRLLTSQLPHLSCLSPDYDNEALPSEPIKEIKHIAMAKLEDPRVTSRRYLVNKDSNRIVSLCSKSAKDIKIVPINKLEWDMPKEPLVPEALKQPPLLSVTQGKAMAKDVGLDFDPISNLSLESGEIKSGRNTPIGDVITENLFEPNETDAFAMKLSEENKINIESTSQPIKYKIPKLKRVREETLPQSALDSPVNPLGKLLQDLKSNCLLTQKRLDIVEERKQKNEPVQQMDDLVKHKDEMVKQTDKLVKHKDEVEKRIDKTGKNIEAFKSTVNPAKPKEKTINQNDKLVKRTDRPVKQIDKPVRQADKSVKQTDKPIKQTEKPDKQKDESVKHTTDKPVKQKGETGKQKDEALKQTDEPAEQSEKPVKQKDESVKHATDKPVKQKVETGKQKDEALKQTDEPTEQSEKPVKQKDESVKHTSDKPVKQKGETGKQKDEALKQTDEPTEQSEKPVKQKDKSVKHTTEKPVKQKGDTAKQKDEALNQTYEPIKQPDKQYIQKGVTDKHKYESIKQTEKPMKQTDKPVIQEDEPLKGSYELIKQNSELLQQKEEHKSKKPTKEIGYEIKNVSDDNDPKEGIKLCISLRQLKCHKPKSAREIVEGDLELSDETCDDSEMQQNLSLKEKDNMEKIDVDIKHATDRFKSLDNKNSDQDSAQTGPEISKKPKIKRKSHKIKGSSPKETSDTVHESDNQLEKRSGKKSKEDTKSINQDKKTKFTELFGESSSLMTPEDLGLSVAQVPPNKYLSIFEDAQDAIDVYVEGIGKTQTASSADPNKDNLLSKTQNKTFPKYNYDIKYECRKADEVTEVKSSIEKSPPHLEIQHDLDLNKETITQTCLDAQSKLISPEVIPVSDSATDLVEKQTLGKVSEAQMKNLVSETASKEQDVVKTVVISTGVQSQSSSEALPVDRSIVNLIDDIEKHDLKKALNTPIHALATSTPYKSIPLLSPIESDSRPSSSSRDIKLVKNDTSFGDDQSPVSNSLDVQNSDLPDLRIFVRRRRKAKK